MHRGVIVILMLGFCCHPASAEKVDFSGVKSQEARSVIRRYQRDVRELTTKFNAAQKKRQAKKRQGVDSVTHTDAARHRHLCCLHSDCTIPDALHSCPRLDCGASSVRISYLPPL